MACVRKPVLYGFTTALTGFSVPLFPKPLLVDDSSWQTDELPCCKIAFRKTDGRQCQQLDDQKTQNRALPVAAFEKFQVRVCI